MVRIPAEQLLDSPRFPVGETEDPMERLVGNGSQGRMVSGVPDGPR